MNRLPNTNPEAGFSAIVQITALSRYDDASNDPLSWIAAGRLVSTEQPLLTHEGRWMDQSAPHSIVMVAPDDMNHTLKELNELDAPIGATVRLKNVRVLGSYTMAIGNWELVSDAEVASTAH